jgi:outer membrane protein OmpA-like peptidoglycan-associated protein
MKGVFSPLANNEQFIFTSAAFDSAAPGSNPYHNRLFVARLKNDSLDSIEPENIEGYDNSTNQGAACISADGKRLFFTQWKTENGLTRSSIYVAEKKDSDWSRPELVSINQNGSNSKQPFCTADGRYLYFASDRIGGQGGYDIWYAAFRADGSPGAPVNAGPSVNTTGNEQPSYYHGTSHTLVFASDGRLGMGGYDLYQSVGSDTSWQPPVNLGYPVNSSRDDVYFFSTGKNSMFENAFFSSDRGSECCLASYTVIKLPKKKMVSGIVVDCENQQPLGNATINLTNNSGIARTVMTSAEGLYNFQIENEAQGSFSISKDDYLDTTGVMTIERKSETAWHTDTLFNATICLAKNKPVIKVENVITIYFDFNRSNLNEKGLKQMDSIFQVMKADSLAVIQVSGYTDGLGSAAYNAMLSDKRSRACADYLLSHGIDATRIRFEAFGACCPVEMELINGRDNPGGRSMNRRAMINIIRM